MPSLELNPDGAISMLQFSLSRCRTFLLRDMETRLGHQRRQKSVLYDAIPSVHQLHIMFGL
jgi:hypothetical protein